MLGKRRWGYLVMIKPRLPAGNRCLSAQSERFSSINACDLVPAAPYPTKIHSFPIYHALDASEPQLALFERGLPSSFSGPHWNNSSTRHSLWSLFTLSYVPVECMLVEVQPARWTHAVSLHASRSKHLSSWSSSRTSVPVTSNQVEFRNQCGSNCEQSWQRQSLSLKRTSFKGLWDAGIVNYQKMVDPDGLSSRASAESKFDIWLIICLENDSFCQGSFMFHILCD